VFLTKQDEMIYAASTTPFFKITLLFILCTAVAASNHFCNKKELIEAKAIKEFIEESNLLQTEEDIREIAETGKVENIANISKIYFTVKVKYLSSEESNPNATIDESATGLQTFGQEVTGQMDPFKHDTTCCQTGFNIIAVKEVSDKETKRNMTVVSNESGYQYVTAAYCKSSTATCGVPAATSECHLQTETHKILVYEDANKKKTKFANVEVGAKCGCLHTGKK